MADQYYLLSSADKAVLDDLILERRNRIQQVNTQNRAGDQGIDHQEIFTPEVYIALTPIAGIPAMIGTGGIPGSADCDIYRVINGALDAISSFRKTVYNLTNSDIGGSVWILASRDKFGTWVANLSGSAGTSLLVQGTPGTADVFPDTRVLEFNLSAGFALTQPAANTVEVTSTLGTNAQAALGVTYALTGVAADTGLQITIPDTGTYLLIAQAAASVTAGAGGTAVVGVHIYNSTTAAYIKSAVGCFAQVSQGVSQTIIVHTNAALTAGDVIKLRANFVSLGVASGQISAGIAPTADTHLAYIRIA